MQKTVLPHRKCIVDETAAGGDASVVRIQKSSEEMQGHVDFTRQKTN
jgi:hypothetical protein